MKCFNHPDRDAVMQCQCTKGLCHECAGYFQPPMCEQCAQTAMEQEAQGVHDAFVKKLQSIYFAIDEIKWAKTKAYLFLIWTLTAIGIGVYLAIRYERPMDNSLLIIFCCLGASGLVWFLFGGLAQPKSMDKQIAGIRGDLRWMAISGNNSALVMLVMFILKVWILFPVSMLLTPIFMVVMVIRLFAYKKEKTRLLELIEKTKSEYGNK